MKVSQLFVDHFNLSLGGVKEVRIEAVSVGKNHGLIVSVGHFEPYDLMFGGNCPGRNETWDCTFASLLDGCEDEFELVYQDVLDGPKNFQLP